MYKMLALTFLFFGVTTLSYSNDVYNLSMTDVNRIICTDNIKDVVFSEEKGLITKVSGKEVFVKFPVTIMLDQETGVKETVYTRDSTELFLVCGEATYSLLLKPVKIPAQTINLKATTSTVDIEAQSKDQEDTLTSLMKLAIEDKLPKSFKRSSYNVVKKIPRVDAELTVIYKQSFIGSGYTIKEYHIHSTKEVTLFPTELIAFKGVKNPAAALLTSEHFRGWSRGFIIERGVR